MTTSTETALERQVREEQEAHEGNLDVVVGAKTLKVHSLSKPAGADWVTEANA
jgi:hypothetical protein